MKKKMVASALLTFLLLANTAAFAQSPSWTRWRGPNGDGVSTETNWNPKALEGGAKVAWKADIGFGFSDVVIQEGRLYTMGLVKGKWTFHCLDAGSGKVIWQQSFDSVGEPDSTPCIDGDRVYGLGTDGVVVCLQSSDGKLLWRVSLEKDFDIPRQEYGWASSPVVEGKLLLLSAGFAGMALDKMTGELVWTSIPNKVEARTTRGSGYYSTPLVCDFDGKRCGLFYGQMSLSAVDLATGQRVWSFLHWNARPVADPIVSGTRVFLSKPKTSLIEMAPGAPRTLWTNSDLLAGTCTPVLVEGFVYGTQQDQSFGQLAWHEYEAAAVPVRCLELATGKLMWESAQKVQVSQVCAAAGKLILLEVGGKLHIVEASPVEYREISSADVLRGANRPRRFAVPPVLCGGRIYCRNYAGDLVCIDMSR